MKKRDKTKAYKMKGVPQLMPKRNKKVIYPSLTKEKIKKEFEKIFIHGEYLTPLTPTESFRFEIIDLGSNQKVATKSSVKGPKIKIRL